MAEVPRVQIRYHRPPDRVQIFNQALVHDTDHVKITLAEAIDFDPAMRIDGDIVLEEGSHVVWFTYPGEWHDVGRFHRADGTFTGIYANILTPPVIRGRAWETTDLFLDVWITPAGDVQLLDADELDEAVEREWVDVEIAARARQEAHDLMERCRIGTWPPSMVQTWTLERCREVLGG